MINNDENTGTITADDDAAAADETESAVANSSNKRKLDDHQNEESNKINNINNNNNNVNEAGNSDSMANAVIETEQNNSMQLQVGLVEQRNTLLDTASQQLKKKLCLHKLKNLNAIRMQCIGDLSEQFYLENSFNYLNFNKFLLNSNICPTVTNATADTSNSSTNNTSSFKLNDQATQVLIIYKKKIHLSLIDILLTIFFKKKRIYEVL